MANEEAPLNLPEDIVSFNVPSVPQWYDFSHKETPEEISAREAFFTTGPTRVYDQENLAPAAPAPQFKAPAPPAPRPATSAPVSSDTLTAGSAHSEDSESPNLGQLAAFRGPRAPLRRSTQQQQPTPATNAPTATTTATQRTQQHQPRSLTAGAAAAARAAERRRSASATRTTERRRSGTSSTSAAPDAVAPTNQQPPRLPQTRVRASSVERPTTARTQSSSSTSSGVMTRAMAAAAAASGADNVAPANEDTSVAALSAGVARLAVRQSRPVVAAPAQRRPSGANPSAPTGAVRVAASTTATSRPAAPAPVRVAAPLRAADRFLAASAAGSGRAASTAAAVATRGGGGMATATATGSAVRPQSAQRKLTSESISRLAAPRTRPSTGAPSTPARRPFGAGLRNYQKDDRPAGTVTIPDTPHFRVDRRASSTTRAPSTTTEAPPPAPASAPRAPVNVSRLVARLSAPRPQRVPPAAGGEATGNTSLPPAQPRRLNAVPLGRTHGMPVVRRTTTNTATATIRSRSNSAARAAAAAGGVVEGANSLRTAL